MKKIDNITLNCTKIFELNDQDIELIVRLLHQESDHHVYELDNGFFSERYDHIQDLIMELTK